MNYQGQAHQDRFVAEMTKFKKNGYFVEIGSNHYKDHNNSFVLETQLGWKGIMIDFIPNMLSDWKRFRPNSTHVIDNATKIDYLKLFQQTNMPNNIDYLQIDLDVNNRSTLQVLEYFDKNIFGKYKFATITFEHDIYTGNFFDTKKVSREVFKKYGYELIFPDVTTFWTGKQCEFEDWWVHPDLIDMEFVNNVRKTTSVEGKSIVYCK